MNSKSANFRDRQIDARVRMRRLLANMSQKALGSALGVTYQQVQKYENGVNRIGASNLQRIAITLKTPPSFFLDGGDVDDEPRRPFPPEQRQIVEVLSTPEGLSLNRSFARIGNPEVRRSILSLVIAIAGSESEAE